ncbi:RNA-binding protein 2-like isoform X2 [Primulina eburnea]|uniref:RNA-binding protein 2-like isoform X2 n=1 Tax=Primulina eburnea TaxID=1245227 RepID=UPI003C6CB388
MLFLTNVDLPPIEGNFASEIFSRNHDLDGSRPIKDTQSLGSAYDNYLRSSQSHSEEGSQFNQMGVGNAASRVMPAFHLQDHLAINHLEDVAPELAPNDRGTGFGPPPVNRITVPREIIPLPPDASSTLYIEGLPPNSTRREVAHIFRPFVGYKEVRLVRKDSKHRGGDPLILCFVDFVDAACAATALSALQGYKMDEEDADSPYLRLQFSKSPGRRSAPGSRWRR